MNGLKLSAEISELSQGALEGIYEDLLEETEKISLLDEAAEYGGIMEMANWGDPIEGKASGYSFQSGMVAKSPSE